MLRPSDLSTPSDFAIEHQREDLRDRRWDRRCKIAGVLAMCVFSLSHLLS
jgi:hypothetical protein